MGASRRRTPPASGFVALSGTPGTGKSAVARRLPARFRPTEVADLALELGTGRRAAGRTVVVDLDRTVRRLPPPRVRSQVLVGHLAHLLPVRYVILLRCHPVVLARRLARARRGSPNERVENVTSEAIDLILVEARRAHRRVVEVDTTGRSADEVARRVAGLLRRGGRARSDPVDWLSDPTVTDYLLRHLP